MVTTEKPAACPFCGGNDISVLDTFAFCEDCSGEGPAICAAEETALALWNRRPGLHLPEPGTPEWTLATLKALEAFRRKRINDLIAMEDALLAAAGRTE